MKILIVHLIFFVLSPLLGTTMSQAQEIGVFPRVGQSILVESSFKNEKGQAVQIKDYFQDNKPAILAVVYYACSSLCNIQLNSMVNAYKKIELQAGKDFNFLVLSMNPEDDPEIALEKKEAYLAMLNQPSAKDGWHFLTGTEKAIRDLTNQIGFKFNKRPDGEFDHVSTSIIVSPDGKIFRYINGNKYNPRTFYLSLLEAGTDMKEKIVDRLQLFLFEFRPEGRSYFLNGVAAIKVMGAALGLTLILFILPFLRDPSKK